MAKKLNPKVLSGFVAGRSNSFLIGRCEFCNSKAKPDHTTMYGNHICSTCHKTLLKHGGSKKSPQETEMQMRSWEDQRLAELTAHSGFSTAYPVSHTQQEIERKSASLGIKLFLAGVVILWVADELSLLATVLALVVSILVARAYQQEKLQEHATIINSEMEDSKRVSEEDRARRSEQLKEQIANESRRWFGRYQMIISKSVERGILLYEYHLLDYPPDWNERSFEVKRRHGNHCSECGTANATLQVHHKVPVKRGGTHHLSNLVALCGRCHMKEHPHLLEER